MNKKEITDYLHDCRWCNFKKEIEQERVRNIEFEKMPYDDGKKLFVIGKAELEDGDVRYFSMPLAKKQEITGEEKFLTIGGETYTDALVEPDFWRSFMALMDEHDGFVKFDNGWFLEREDFLNPDIIDELKYEDSKALGVEQSNTTLNVGDGKLAFKLERMLEFSHEVNSEFEVNEKLMRENCSVMPKSFGGFVLKKPNGEQASSGIMLEFVKNKGDMWNYLQDVIGQELNVNYLRQKDLKAENNPNIMSMIRNLSEKTKEMSDCFSRADSNPNFTPEKVDESFIRGYAKQFEVLLYQTKRQISDSRNNLPAALRLRADKLLAVWDEKMPAFVNEKLDKVRALDNKGTINRVHGDFHLGQVMVTEDNDLRFIDFAGEPALSMKERKQKYIHVRDIAGMYRSIKGYLGAVAVEDFAAKATDDLSAARRKAWAEKAIRPLIDSASRAFLGNKTMNNDPWLSLEVLRKNLYEVKYEVSFRPNMAYVPINGLFDLMNLDAPVAVNTNDVSLAKTGTERS